MTTARFPTYAAEELTAARRSRGEPVVPLHGTPTPPLPAHVVAAVADALAGAQRTAPARGLVGLRRLLAEELHGSTGRSVDDERELLVTNGAMQALGVCLRALVGAGDEIVVPAPCFFFEGPIRAAGAEPVYVSRSHEDGWRWDADAVAAAVGPRTRALLLCNPCNPTGALATSAEVDDLVGRAVEAGLLVVSDEAYEAAVWEDGALASAFALAPEVLLVRSLGKSLSMPTLRIGLLAGRADLVDRCARVLEWDCLRVGVAAQHAAAAALAGDRAWLRDVRLELERSRELALAAVADVGLPVVPPAATPFLFLGDGTDAGLGRSLADAGLPVVDGAAFAAPGFARLPFGGIADAREELEAALARWAAGRS